MDNVYTQHQPLLYDTIDNINKGRVPAFAASCVFHPSDFVPAPRSTGNDADYPYAGPALSAKERPQVRHARGVRWCLRRFSWFRLQDIFIFVVGGATYEEARAVALLNAANKQQRVILGSTCLLNSATFLAEFEKAAAAQ